MNPVKTPWLKHYGEIPAQLDYPDCTMFEYVEQSAAATPDNVAIDFMGTKITYAEFVARVHNCARALKAVGLKENDRVTICMPNTPQALVMFYALNVIGALPNMIHPLSAQGEIEFYLNFSHSVAAITLDAFYGKFAAVRGKTPDLQLLIIAKIKEELKPLLKLGFSLTTGRRIKPIPENADVLYWSDFIKMGQTYKLAYRAKRSAGDPAVVLYSGGTTGTTKGILLSNLNFNALSMQVVASGDCVIPGHSMLAIMPIFHGFGLGVCIHTILTHSCKCILVPQFNAETYANLLRKQKPNYIAGVPTLYEALLRNKHMDGVDLSCLEGMFSGGDSLSVELKKKVDLFLRAHNAKIQVREGYGTTECVTASCLTPKDFAKEGSIGIPFPDTYYKIVSPNTHTELPYGEIGEICLAGPTVMLEYIDNPKETAHTLQQHEDGMTWLHTGDLGYMDEDGFIYFKQRLKRMIVSSGYNIYPSQIENIIDAHEAVLMSTVIGVPDPYKIQKVKAFVVLRPEIEPTDAVKKDIEEHCRKNIAKYAMPYEFEYRESLPQTLVGKVAYTVLEKEEHEKQQAAKEMAAAGK